jgi:hypothetical protein
MQPEIIDDYRARFREAPFGVWSTCPTEPADQTLRFFSDRRGVCQVARRLGGGIIHFEWQHHEECCLRIRRIDPRTGLPKSPNEWLFLRYDFDYVELRDNDAVVMRLIEFGRLKEFAGPLYFHGSAEKGSEELLEEEPGPRPEPLSEQLHGRMLIALFIAGMIVGLGIVVAEALGEDVDPLVFWLGGIGLFVFLYYLLSRPRRPKHSAEDDYIREQE